MVSLKDISEKCGVSIATVSKALNDHHDIGEATKERIREVAKEMGYHPNSSARALKTKRTYNIGVLFVDEARSGLTHDYFAGVLDSFKRRSEQSGYDITFINCSKVGINRMTYLQRCKHRGFDGVVIACIEFSDPEVVELVNSSIPVVTIDHVFNDCMAILSDNVSGMKDLVKYVCECGHKRIAYIHGNPTSVTSARLSSFHRTTEEYGIVVPEEYIKKGNYRGIRDSERFTKELLDMDEPPTCIFYPDDYSAMGGINEICERGLRIPEDISIVGYDGSRVGKHLVPPLTTMKQDTDQIGKLAAEKLIEMIEKPKTTIREQIIVEGTLWRGGSVRNIKADK